MRDAVVGLRRWELRVEVCIACEGGPWVEGFFEAGDYYAEVGWGWWESGEGECEGAHSVMQEVVILTIGDKRGSKERGPKRSCWEEDLQIEICKLHSLWSMKYAVACSRAQQVHE